MARQFDRALMTVLRPTGATCAVAAAFTVLLFVISAAIAIVGGFPFLLPEADPGGFVSIHYVFPLAGACLVAVAASRFRLSEAVEVLVLFICFAIVLLLHFNLKLWSHHLSHRTYDDLYWTVDAFFRPAVDASLSMTRLLAGLPGAENLYMQGFLAMFYVSLLYHAMHSRSEFRELYLSLLFIQGAGAVAYLVAPALGPFIFEAGALPAAAGFQDIMHEQYLAAMTTGHAWYGQSGGRWLTAGLAAMPSLHAGTAYIFLRFAARYGKPLLILYVPLFAYIVVVAVGSRWHYLVDIPVGLALAHFCMAVARAVRRTLFDKAAGVVAGPVQAGVSRDMAAE